MRLRLMTYNIHRAIGVDRRFRPLRIVEIVAHHDPDLILLQEVDQGAPRSSELDLAHELASHLDYAHYAVGHNVRLRKGRYGNATLSRWPITYERNIDLTIDSHKRRGCQHTRVRLGPGGAGRELEVFNVHFGLSAKERTRQIGRLVRSTEYTGLDPERPCIIGGDFNDWRSLLHAAFTELLGFDCATQDRFAYRRGLYTYPAFSPRGSLDKVYFRGPIELVSARTCRLRASKVASDHLPVIVDFEVGS